jgi:hypothetical protein
MTNEERCAKGLVPAIRSRSYVGPSRRAVTLNSSQARLVSRTTIHGFTVLRERTQSSNERIHSLGTLRLVSRTTIHGFTVLRERERESARARERERESERERERSAFC